MADIYNSNADWRTNLINGENVTCPHCKQGLLKPKPVGIEVNKATYFECNNEKCDYFIRYDLAIDIE